MGPNFQPVNPFDEETLGPEDALFSGPDLDEEARLGMACQQLLDSEAYRRATSTLQKTIWEAFQQTPVRDADGLTYLRLMQKTVEDLHRLLQDTADTGRLSAAQLTDLQQQATQSDS